MTPDIRRSDPNSRLNGPKCCVIIFSLLSILWLLILAFGQQTINSLYTNNTTGIFQVPEQIRQYKTPGEIYFGLSRFVLILIALSFVSMLLCIWKRKIVGCIQSLTKCTETNQLPCRLFSLFILLGCSWTCFYVLLNQGFEGDWYKIGELMTFHWQPPFQYRLFFIFQADLLKAFFPRLTYIQAFCLTQIIPIILLFYFAKKWASIFIDEHFAFVGQLIMLLMIIPTISYYTFYDMGIICTFTIGLYAIFRRNQILYFVTFLCGLLNHEITILLSISYLLIFYREQNSKKVVLLSFFVQALAFFSLRLTLQTLLPYPYLVENGKIWINLILDMKRLFWMFNTIATLGIWYFLAIIGYKFTPLKLRLCFPMGIVLIAITLLVGQLNEPRMFNSFMPVVTASILCLINEIRSVGFSDTGKPRIR